MDTSTHTAVSLVSVLLNLVVSCSIAYEINCGTNQCQNTTINCPENETCLILCDGDFSCNESVINCPLNGDCDIECHGQNACSAATVNALSSIGNFDLLCKSSANVCRKIKVYGSMLQTNIDNYFNVECDEDVRSCAESTIHCAKYSECSISCNKRGSCRSSIINGPINNDIFVNCFADSSCFEAIINAQYAADLTIKGCETDQSCLDLTVYCPSYSNGHKHCFIEGNNNLAQSNSNTQGLVLYAVNGWQDIQINYNGTFNIAPNQYLHGGTMYCSSDYSKSCDISATSWSCTDNSCNLPINTNAPSTEDNSGVIVQVTEPIYIIEAAVPHSTKTIANSIGSTVTEDSTQQTENMVIHFAVEFEMIVVFLAAVLVIIICIIGVCCLYCCTVKRRENRDVSDVKQMQQIHSLAAKNKFSTLNPRRIPNPTTIRYGSPSFTGHNAQTVVIRETPFPMPIIPAMLPNPMTMQYGSPSFSRNTAITDTQIAMPAMLEMIPDISGVSNISGAPSIRSDHGYYPQMPQLQMVKTTSSGLSVNNDVELLDIVKMFQKEGPCSSAQYVPQNGTFVTNDVNKMDLDKDELDDMDNVDEFSKLPPPPASPIHLEQSVSLEKYPKLQIPSMPHRSSDAMSPPVAPTDDGNTSGRFVD